MIFKILFIDEEKSAHRSFKKDFLDSNRERFSGKSIYPEAALEGMIEKIFEYDPDVVLTDFSLNDKKADLPSMYTVEYNGGDIAREVLNRRKNFPVFITTSLGDDAALDGNDVKLIYEKYGSFKENKKDDHTVPDRQHLTFADKVYYEVVLHKKFIELASEEFDLLVSRRQENQLGLSDETRLSELESILESYLDLRSKLPDELRIISNVEKLDSLILKAEKLIKISGGQS